MTSSPVQRVPDLDEQSAKSSMPFFTDTHTTHIQFETIDSFHVSVSFSGKVVINWLRLLI
jgi:hypothetical protein